MRGRLVQYPTPAQDTRMAFFKRLIDYTTLGSPRPMQRLVAYYAMLGAVTALVIWAFPSVGQVLAGGQLDQLSAQTPVLLEDGLAPPPETVTTALAEGAQSVVATLISFLMALALMLPVSWVYMSIGRDRAHNQTVAQTLIVLPLVVAGVVMVVQNSLALAFSLAGVVAAVRFRTTLSDTRDIVFIFLAIAIGFAVGVQVLSTAAILSIVFNIVLLLIWRYDFGRNVLQPTPSEQWTEPLKELTAKDEDGEAVPDRELVLALTPKKAEVLAKRFDRVAETLGSNGKKPRYDAVVSVEAAEVDKAQREVESVLERATKRWKLDEVITNTGKPSEIHYLVRTRKSVPRTALVTAIREQANGNVKDVNVELSNGAKKDAK
jgi:hypothetical protein